MNEEWIEWAGGPCPVDPLTMVEAKMRYRIHTSAPIKAEARCFRQWVHTRGPNPECDNGFCEGNGDIVAYRVVLA